MAGRAPAAGYIAKVRRAPRRPWVTLALCALAVLLALAGDDGAAARGPLAHQLALVGSGAKSRALLSDAGEGWRIFTAHFVHTGWTHLVFNLAFFFPASAALEGLVRRTDHVALLVALACGSGLASAYFTAEVSAGLSGLVFGCLAAAVGFGLGQGRRLGPRVRAHFGWWVLPFLVFVLAVGWGNPLVDHASHLGGLVVGALAGPFLRRPTRTPFVAEPVAPMVVAGIVAGGSMVLAPWLARGGAERETWWALPDGGHVAIPVAWQPRLDPLGHIEFRPVGGLVTFQTDRVPAPARDDPAAWYDRTRLRPLARAGLLEIVATGAPRRHAGKLALRARVRRGGVTMLREVWFLPSPAGDLRMATFEVPAAWARKYGETKTRLLESLDPAARPASGAPRTVSAAAIP